MRTGCEGAGDEPVADAPFLHTILDALEHAVIVTDPQGRILLWNAGAEGLYGWGATEVIGTSILDVLAPIDDRAQNEADLSSVAAGAVMTGDRLVRRRDGSIVQVHSFTRPLTDDSGAVVALVGTSEDVTWRRAAEQQLRDLTEHFRAALRAGGLGTWRWDRATGSTVWDERLEVLFGLEPGTFDGTFETYVALLHPDDRGAVLARIDAAVENRSTFRIEHRVILPDGSVRWIEGVGGVTVDERDVVIGAVGCSMDATERIEQELEKERLAAAALEVAERERVQRERLEFLSSINDAINGASTVAEIMSSVTQVAVPRLGDWCSIHVLPEHGEPIPEVEVAHVDPEMVAYARELRERFPYDPDAPAGVPAIVRTGRTEFRPEISEEMIDALDIPEGLRDVVRRLDLRSSIGVAMKKRRRVLGAIQFVRSGGARPYTQDDVALAETVAGRLASSIENLRLHERQREIAYTLQQSLLPATLPTIPGVEVAVRYWPTGGASEVGGDFYDVFAIGPESWAVVIGDVCGTGPTAAASTALARHTIRAGAWRSDDPVEVLRSLNVALRRSGAETFLTSLYATIDLGRATPSLTVASGGHPLPVHVGADGARAIGATGTLLGIFDEVRVEPTVTELHRGDVVVFYTDGATDVPPPHSLDADAFAAMVDDAVAPGEGAEDTADRIHRALDSTLTFSRRSDDIALVILRVV